MNIFGHAILRINYHDDIKLLGGSLVVGERAIIVAYTEDGFAIPSTKTELAVDKIPTLLFQLVEHGYSISLDTSFETDPTNIIGAKSILAVSQAGMDGLARRFGNPVFEKEENVSR